MDLAGMHEADPDEASIAALEFALGHKLKLLRQRAGKRKAKMFVRRQAKKARKAKEAILIYVCRIYNVQIQSSNSESNRFLVEGESIKLSWY